MSPHFILQGQHTNCFPNMTGTMVTESLPVFRTVGNLLHACRHSFAGFVGIRVALHVYFNLP